MDWLRRNLSEIQGDPALRLYGGCLALTHVLTALYYWQGDRLAQILGSPEVICWPFWLDCGAIRGLLPPAPTILLVYLLFGLVSTALFLKPTWTGRAWLGLLFLNLFKLALVVVDFRLRMNQHYMAGIATIVFLFLPAKRSTLKLLLCCFYVWAGLLKLNDEWLSGSALYAPLWLFGGSLLPLACTYVVVLELLLVWGVLSKRPELFYFSLLQLGIFHLFSWPVVGFFYPTLMFCLLAIVLLDRFIPAGPARQPMPLRAPSWVFLGAFSLAQIVPWLMPGDTRLTGEGRLFALHMFDSRTRCESKAILKKQGVRVEKRMLYRPLAQRIHCDPLVQLQRARALCQGPERGALFDDLDLLVDTQLSSAGARPTRVVDVRDFCSKPIRYRLFWHNDWIETE